ncbi:hypothetical protein HPB52_001407 [Rhipicephalus sanguineus]|uniref:Uncharacterized protein n=1 Tax=Rhipicephalus sanguineus TaxID=34632 RepID=A0A9D4P9M1_RHISA|nr:hypothetical protein HPB52_001407 [Rhipicephalus sanguineus]
MPTNNQEFENKTFIAWPQLEHVIFEDFPDVQLRPNFMATLRERNCRKSQKSKLDALRPPDDAQTQTGVLNLSSYKGTASEVAVLREGFNSGASPKRTRVICAVERAVTLLPHEVRDEARTRALCVLSKWRTHGPRARVSIFYLILFAHPRSPLPRVRGDATRKPPVEAPPPASGY